MRLWSVGRAVGLRGKVLGRLTTSPISPGARHDCIPFGSADFLRGFGGDWDEYPAVLCTDSHGALSPEPLQAVYAPPNLDYLEDKDVVALGPDGSVRVWYRRRSENNTILMTEQCNSLCLMCSQPPKQIDDSYRVPQILRLLELIDSGAVELVLSGGEPTLLGEGFLRIIDKARTSLPSTALHVLTNGRRFKNSELADRLSAIGHPDLVLGIPLYSDIDSRHDYVVQARGAYDETLLGFYNLAQAGVRLELRVVLHKQTVDRLPQLARFIARNLPFVEHVALMGLEMFGYTPQNLSVLWIDPVDYQPQLAEAVELLALSGMNVSIYNHQLCTIPQSLWPFARKSISDWKNVYLPECDDCGVKGFCGGFFQSATKKHSAGIRRLPPLDQATRRAMAEFHGSPPVEGADGFADSFASASTAQTFPKPHGTPLPES